MIVVKSVSIFTGGSAIYVVTGEKKKKGKERKEKERKRDVPS